MSMPTLYIVKNASGDKLGVMRTSIFTWSPLTRSDDKQEFLAEVGELIIKDLLVYLSGKQKGAEFPRFELSDVATIESEGGKVQACELVQCVEAYLENIERTERYMVEGTENPDSDDLSNLNEIKEKAHLSISILKKTFSPTTPSPVPAPGGFDFK